jgi:hypothetical protein
VCSHVLFFADLNFSKRVSLLRYCKISSKIFEIVLTLAYGSGIYLPVL